MLNVVKSFAEDLTAGPTWVIVWVAFMGIVFLLAIPFSLSRVEARRALVAMALAFPGMLALYHVVGMVRLLGVVHVVLWTPLAVYLWRRRSHWRVRETLAGKWTALLFATIFVSLAFDYTDVVRYLLGESS